MAKEPDKADPLARMVRSRAIDLLVLADCSLTNAEVLDALNRHKLDFTTQELPHAKVRFFRRPTAPELVPTILDDRFQFVRLTAPGFEEILLGATHLYDRQHNPTPVSRLSKILGHMTTLRNAESEAGHYRTLLVGDFNMTPEEAGMIDPNAFGSLMSWDLAQAQSSPEPEGRPRFYNPMWSIMGREQAPGTYYWNSTQSDNIYWLCLDGVIARHSLRGVFRDETLVILTTIPDRIGQEVPLIRFAEKHWKIEFSDHLPFCFELHFKPNRTGTTT